MAMKHPSIEETDTAIARMRERLGTRNVVLARWFTDTLAIMEAKIASRLEDPNDRAQARAAAFLFVKAALHQWATRPAHEEAAKDGPAKEAPPSRRIGIR
ncbi:hypothetical protein FHX15_004941 [Rhizobium sp. BK650]|uniref:hypothetical protein n=1 Tax=Rhizobium sp. BK650 TaxID=2586990 RepID=UPI0017E12520|nr:hypothetical protein [Rhizobium sp. BK650]MBB3659675.1 hypothetical protein [Rhizobium sp. BK650]